MPEGIITSSDINTQFHVPVMEKFLTIQGEGYHSGRLSYFIRLAGCDVGCVWCDVKESWDVSDNQIEPIDDVVSYGRNLSSHCNFAVITGGEPLMYDLKQLTSALKKENFEIAIETSGAHPFSGQIDWVCLSPKKFKPTLPEFYELANELKVVIYHKSDFDFALEHASKVSKDCKLYLQPEWDRSASNIPMIISFIKENPEWNISLQTHKFMNIP